MNARCGLEDCDCEYTIGGLLRRLEMVAEACTAGLHPATDMGAKDGVFQTISWMVKRTTAQTRDKTECDSSCPCFQAGYEAERQPVGA